MTQEIITEVSVVTSLGEVTLHLVPAVQTIPCAYCGLDISLVNVDPDNDGGDWHWTHTQTGYYTCALALFIQSGAPWSEYKQDQRLLTLASPTASPWREGMKSTDCAGSCCYNAVKDQCIQSDCDCHSGV